MFCYRTWKWTGPPCRAARRKTRAVSADASSLHWSLMRFLRLGLRVWLQLSTDHITSFFFFLLCIKNQRWSYFQFSLCTVAAVSVLSSAFIYERKSLKTIQSQEWCCDVLVNVVFVCALVQITSTSLSVTWAQKSPQRTSEPLSLRLEKYREFCFIHHRLRSSFMASESRPV